MQSSGIATNAWREFWPAFIIVVNTIVWYALNYNVLSSIIQETQSLQKDVFFLGYYLAIAFSAIIGAVLLPRAKKAGLILWMVFGAIMSLVMTTIPSNGDLINGVIFILSGTSIGIGLPSALAFFAHRTHIERRGFLGGISWTAIGFAILGFFFVIGIFGTTLGLLTLSIWRFLGLGLFLLLDREGQVAQPINLRNDSYRHILGRRDVLLYLLPWIMFSIINFLEAPIIDNLMGELAVTFSFVEFAITGIFAILGGMFADRIGRKRVVIAGFVLLGMGYAMLSLFFGNPSLWYLWYLYTVLDGATWGMFAAVFFMALWGDLSLESRKEKYYVLGGLPYLLSGFLPIMIEPYVGLIQPVMAFSLASFFLFIAVLPLIYAPETLPEKHIKDKELKTYIEKAQKMVNKDQEKNRKQNKSAKSSQGEEPTQQNSEEHEKAKKLAEKYY